MAGLLLADANLCYNLTSLGEKCMYKVIRTTNYNPTIECLDSELSYDDAIDLAIKAAIATAQDASGVMQEHVDGATVQTSIGSTYSYDVIAS
jgi:hypothetical protein